MGCSLSPFRARRSASRAGLLPGLLGRGASSRGDRAGLLATSPPSVVSSSPNESRLVNVPSLSCRAGAASAALGLLLGSESSERCPVGPCARLVSRALLANAGSSPWAGGCLSGHPCRALPCWLNALGEA